MKSFIDFIVNHKKTTFFILISLMLALIGCPFLINCLFKISAPIWLLEMEWGAEDVLNYYGSTLTFLGTSILSIIALWQNHIIKEANDKHTMILEQMERKKNYPFFVLEYVSSLGNSSNIQFKVKNVSDNIAKNVVLLDFAIKNKKNEVLWSGKQKISKDYMLLNSDCKIELNNKEISAKEKFLNFKIEYVDKFEKKHECYIKAKITYDSILCLENIDNILC